MKQCTSFTYENTTRQDLTKSELLLILYLKNLHLE